MKRDDLRNLILNAQDLPVKPLEVPEWNNCTVYLKSLNGVERVQLERDIAAGDKDKTLTYGRIACAVLCDQEGNLLFTPEDIAKLDAKNGGALVRVYEAAMATIAMSQKDIDDLKKE